MRLQIGRSFQYARCLLEEKREDGPQGFTGFAISIRMSDALRAAIREVPETEWKAYGRPEADVDRECAEVVFVSNEELEPKGAKPLRYIAIRLRKRQGGLFSHRSRSTKKLSPGLTSSSSFKTNYYCYDQRNTGKVRAYGRGSSMSHRRESCGPLRLVVLTALEK